MFIKDRVMAKIQGWKQNFLSQAGIEVLIKAVSQTIHAYPMNVFCFPKNLCNDIDSAVVRFWWGQKEGEHKIHSVSWASMGLVKRKGVWVLGTCMSSTSPCWQNNVGV